MKIKLNKAKKVDRKKFKKKFIQFKDKNEVMKKVIEDRKYELEDVCRSRRNSFEVINRPTLEENPEEEKENQDSYRRERASSIRRENLIEKGKEVKKAIGKLWNGVSNKLTGYFG